MQSSTTPSAGWKSRAATRAVLAALVTVAAWLACPSLLAWQQGRFADQLAARALAAQATPESVRRMWQLGLPATEPLARLAGSQRAELAYAAQQGLVDQLASWELEFSNRGDLEMFAKRLGKLSAALSQHAGGLNPDGQLWAQKLARQIAFQCEQISAEDAWPVLTACEVVLAAPVAAQSATHPPSEANNSVAPRPIPAQMPSSVNNIVVEPQALAPAENMSPPRPPGELSVIMPWAEPLVVTPGAKPTATNSANPLRSIEETPVLEERASLTALPNPTAAASSAVVEVPSPLDMRHSKQRLRAMSDQELVASCQTAPRFEAAAARRALRSRGYSDELLELTRQLQQLPAAERKASLERAASLPAAETRRLLRWFVADEDAEVRLHALTMLATTGDPELAEIARQRAIEDADPRVAELATKLLKR
jgi:hypothetical protein